ncbi:MAG: hypothetical protein ACQEXC_14080 [Pseudomonadota bacterium]
MAVTRKPTRKLASRPTRRATQPPRKSGPSAPPAVLAQPTNLTVEEV